jgi:hypothetical protein
MMRNGFIICLILLCACQQQQSDVEKEILLDKTPGQCPYLTKDDHHNTVISWVRMNNDSSSSFCYAIAERDEKFGNTIVIPNSGNIQPHGENLPKIIFKKSGDIVALWGVANPNPGNKYSGAVFYVQSFDHGKSWTAPAPLVKDTGGIDQRYYDVALLPDGEVGVVWLDNRKTKKVQGSGVYFASTAGKQGFGEGRLISEPACQCCRTVLFPDSKGNIHVLYRAIINDSIRDMVHILSNDEGKTFSAPERISNDNWVINACPHTGPAMTENKDGLHFTWFTGGHDRGNYYSCSPRNGKNFSDRLLVSATGSHPQVTAISDENVMITWDETKLMSRTICVQVIDKNEKTLMRKFITKDSTFSSYPVIAKNDDGKCLIAYTSKVNDQPYVKYQFVNIP